MEGEGGLGREGLGALGEHEAELAEEAADGIDPRRARGEQAAAQPMQSRARLLLPGLHRDRVDGVVPGGLQERLGVGPIGLVAVPVAGHVGGWQEPNLVAELLERASPVVAGAAGFEKDRGGLPLREEAREARAGQPMLFLHPARSARDRHLKDRLCQINGQLRSVHEDSSPVCGLRGRCRYWPGDEEDEEIQEALEQLS